ncbi:MAG: glycosyltransferase family 2 protein [Acidobacteriota bacterium]
MDKRLFRPDAADRGEKLGARVIDSPWPGYAKQKNLAAERAENDWILSLDADESLSEALEAEIWQLKKSGPQYDAYTMPRLARYLGRWIRHSGWYPDRKVRLYHRDKAQWVGDFVHESVKVDGSLGHMEGNLLHFYLRVAGRTHEDDGSLHDAGGRADSWHPDKSHVGASSL